MPVAAAQPAATLDQQVHRIVNDAIAPERQRMSRAILDAAFNLDKMPGPGNAIVSQLTILADTIMDPVQ